MVLSLLSFQNASASYSLVEAGELDKQIWFSVFHLTRFRSRSRPFFNDRYVSVRCLPVRLNGMHCRASKRCRMGRERLGKQMGCFLTGLKGAYQHNRGTKKTRESMG